MLNDLKRELSELLSKKIFVISVALTTLLSYFFLWTHPSMGVDDTCVQRYFADGFAPTQGRWTLFLLNKVFHVAEFSPFVVDFIGVLLLVFSAFLLSALFRRLSCGRISVTALTIFSCAMISFPLIGEVFVYYLHNGIGLAYALVAFSVYLMVCVPDKKSLIASSLILAVALSCYESFAMVYILSIALAVMVRFFYVEEKTGFSNYAKYMIRCMIPLIAGMILRSLVANIICMVLGKEANMFSLSQAVKWIFSADVLSHLKGMMGLFGRYYIVNGLANLGVAVYLLSAVAFLIIICYSAVKKKNGMLLLNGMLILLAPWLLSFLQGTVIPYRSMQALPVFVGFVAMFLVGLAQKKGKAVYATAVFLGVVLVYNQAFQLNKMFYVDYLKYEEDVNMCRQIAYDLEKDATLDKPIVFIGKKEDYGTVDSYAYLSEDTLRYKWISEIRQIMGSDTENSYSTVQNFVWYNVFDWGTDAFEGRGTELINFFEWHGYGISQASETMYKEAEQYALEMPVWPKDGSILETEQYVIIKLGDNG